MKPGEHPDFFRFAPPPGTSRESSIVLDERGVFFHDGAPVERRSLAVALASWIRRHPDDGRLILSNGYDWCYFTARDTPFFVDALRVDEAATSATLVLFDGSEEPLDLDGLALDDDGVVVARVRGGAFEAKLSRHAQTQLAPLLVSGEPPRLRLGDREVLLPRRVRS